MGRGRTHRKVLNFRRIVTITLLVSTIAVLGTIGLISSGLLGYKLNQVGHELSLRKAQLIGYQAQYEQLFEIAYGLIDPPSKNRKTNLSKMPKLKTGNQTSLVALFNLRT